MLNVQKYLIENGIEKLKSEFKIKVREYEDRIVLNYDQIESPTFHEIVDECRNLILSKPDFNVVSQSFARFYNLGQGVQSKAGETISEMRIASSNGKIIFTEGFDICKALIQTKLDGSLISVYYFGGKWNIATRSTAIGEGESNFGRTFAELFKTAQEYKDLEMFLSKLSTVHIKHTWIFELTSPESRVVTPFSETHITLIGARNNETGDELDSEKLNFWAEQMKVKRPEQFKFSTLNDIVEFVNGRSWMDEGVVLVFEQPSGSHKRLKVKNLKYLAISHMRENGNISPKSIIRLILTNEQEEYLSYFEDDRKYVDFVQKEIDDVKNHLNEVYNKHKDIVVQKDFALAIMADIKWSFESGIMFTSRKSKVSPEEVSPEEVLYKMEPKKLADLLDLKSKFKTSFNKNVEDEA